MIIVAGMFVLPNQSSAKQAYGFSSSGVPTTSAPGRLQPAYIPASQMSYDQPQVAYHSPQQTNHVSATTHTPTYAVPVQPGQTAASQIVSPAGQYHSPKQYNLDAPLGPSVRVPRGNDLMATDQHRLLQYRRMYRNGTTPHPSELNGQWNGVNKGIVEIAGYGQFIKDIQVDGNGQGYGDNVQVKQVKPGQVRFNGWQPKYDLAAKDYERRGSFAVQRANGRGFFGHGHTFSYADGNNSAKDPARLLEDQVVKIDDNHMLGRAVAKFGPIKIPIAYFVLERRED